MVCLYIGNTAKMYIGQLKALKSGLNLNVDE